MPAQNEMFDMALQRGAMGASNIRSTKWLATTQPLVHFSTGRLDMSESSLVADHSIFCNQASLVREIDSA